MLRLENLHKSFTLEKGEVRAVQGVSFEIKKGEFFALLGPSGSGKSTCLRCVAGLERPEQGEIAIEGRLVFSSRQGIWVSPNERPLGMVFQSYAIWPHMTVANNVSFPLEHGKNRLSRRLRREAVAEALEMVDLRGFENRPATQLSGGQQQRVALARAMVNKPQLLLLDEPLSNLDAKLREEMRHELRALTRSLNITTFFVTHDQIEALGMADKVGVIIDGVLLEVAPPQQLYTKPQTRLVAQFIGISNMLQGVVVESQHRRGKVETEIGTVETVLSAEAKDGTEVMVMVRPEFVACYPQLQDLSNIFQGVVEEAVFLGSNIAARVRIRGTFIRALLDSRNLLEEGQTVWVHLPCDSCIAMK